MLRVWTQDSTPPAVYYAQRPGRWVSEATWPTPHVQPQRFMLSARTLTSEGGPAETQRIRGIQAAGLLSGVWSAFGRPGDLPPDQRQEDGLSLCFDTEPLAEEHGDPRLPDRHAQARRPTSRTRSSPRASATSTRPARRR